MSQPNKTQRPVGPVPSPGLRRLRRLDRVWPDRDGNIAYLLTLCVDERERVLDNEIIFDRLVAFLLDSPTRYRWFGHRFVIMPDHLHLIAHHGQDAVTLGQWVKALKAVVGGLERHREGPVPPPAGSARGDPSLEVVGRLPSAGAAHHGFTRIKRSWRWQTGFHDHKFRTPESESLKWEYICLNPVRARLVERPEQWPYAGEIFYDEPGGPSLIRGTPPLLEHGMLIDETETPREGTRPTT